MLSAIEAARALGGRREEHAHSHAPVCNRIRNPISNRRGCGITFGVRSQGKSPGLDAHPHYEQVMAIGGLVQDGVVWTRTELANRRGDKEAQAPLVSK